MSNSFLLQLFPCFLHPWHIRFTVIFCPDTSPKFHKLVHLWHGSFILRTVFNPFKEILLILLIIHNPFASFNHFYQLHSFASSPCASLGLMLLVLFHSFFLELLKHLLLFWCTLSLLFSPIYFITGPCNQLSQFLFLSF